MSKHTTSDSSINDGVDTPHRQYAYSETKDDPPKQRDDVTPTVVNVGMSEVSSSNQDDLKGTFVVVGSSDTNDSLENDKPEVDNDPGKYLTLVVCRPPSGFRRENVGMGDDSSATHNYNGIEVVNNCDSETNSSKKNSEQKENANHSSCKERSDVSLDSEENINAKQLDEEQQCAATGREQHPDSFVVKDTKQFVKRNASKKPVVGNKSIKELDEALEKGDELGVSCDATRRNNELVSPNCQVLTTSSGQLENGGEEKGGQRKHSTDQVLKELSLGNEEVTTRGDNRGRPKSTRSLRKSPIHCHNSRLGDETIDDRTRDNEKKTRAISIDDNRIISKSSRCHRDNQKTISRRENRISRSSDKTTSFSDYTNSSLDDQGDRQRHVSTFEQRYTMRELRRALPRRSFFSCHDKAIKDAGLETDDPAAKLRAERLKLRLERIASEFTPLSTERRATDCNQANNVDSGNEVTRSENSPGNGTAVEDTAGSKVEIDETAVSEVTSEHEHNSADVTSGLSRHETSNLLSVRPAKKRRPDSSRPQRVDCKPLLQYLEYVRDNKDEYLSYIHASHTSQAPRMVPTSRLVGLGKAFELRHLGGVPRRHNDDVILMAAKALRPRTSDSSKYARHAKDKTGSGGSGTGPEMMRQIRPSSEDKRKQERNSSASHAKEDDHGRTEMERRKLRAEEWSRTVSTNTLTKAKVQSLQELGGEDRELARWWEVFRDCRYLRDTWPVEKEAVV